MDGVSSWLKQQELHSRHALSRRLGRGVPVPLADRPYSVIAVLGQSNAHGAGLGLDRDGLDAPHPEVHQWPSSGRSKGTVVLGVDPLFHDVPSKAVGFACTFAREMACATGEPVLLVPAALGDTSFTPKNGYTWDPVDRVTRANLYRRALEAIDGALATRSGNRLAGVLWHQGESDVPLLSAPDYAVKLDSVIADIRRRYGNDVVFVIGQMVPEGIEQGRAECREIDAVHRDTPNRHNGVSFVAGPRDSYNSPNEVIHYNAAGQRELGRRMWRAFLGHHHRAR
jgi:hypothetical protein